MGRRPDPRTDSRQRFVHVWVMLPPGLESYDGHSYMRIAMRVQGTQADAWEQFIESAGPDGANLHVIGQEFPAPGPPLPRMPKIVRGKSHFFEAVAGSNNSERTLDGVPSILGKRGHAEEPENRQIGRRESDAKIQKLCPTSHFVDPDAVSGFPTSQEQLFLPRSLPYEDEEQPFAFDAFDLPQTPPHLAPFNCLFY